jgi:hypothetical protein
MIRCYPGAQKLVVEFHEVYIVLLMRIYSEEMNLTFVLVQGGFRVESNRPFMGSSMET